MGANRPNPAMTLVADDPVTRVEVIPRDPIVVSRSGAEALRRRYLDPLLESARATGAPDKWSGRLPSSPQVITIDLRAIQMLSLAASDELAVRFLKRLRDRADEAGAAAVFVTASLDILKTLHAALRLGNETAFGIASFSATEPPWVIGEANANTLEALEKVRLSRSIIVNGPLGPVGTRQH